MAKKTIITSIITGDIINSRKINPKVWLTPLKKTLGLQGESPATWEIYRGDSFQLEASNPSMAFFIAIRIKAHIKSVKGIDVRMAIGIGEKKIAAPKITESNGEAFINSGEKLEMLKKEKQNLAVKTPWTDFDREMNLYIRFALIAMDSWTSNAAEFIKILIDNPGMTQTKLADKLKITQSAVSGRQKRSYYSEIIELESLYREKVKNLLTLK